MNTEYWISTIIGGGLLLAFINWVSKKGKVELSDVKATLNVCAEGIQKNSFTAHFQFINYSGFKRIVKHIEISFFTGEEYYDLHIEGHELRPSISIDPKSTITVTYNLRVHVWGLPEPEATTLIRHGGHLLLKYRIGKKLIERKISNEELGVDYVESPFKDAKYE